MLDDEEIDATPTAAQLLPDTFEPLTGNGHVTAICDGSTVSPGSPSDEIPLFHIASLVEAKQRFLGTSGIRFSDVFPNPADAWRYDLIPEHRPGESFICFGCKNRATKEYGAPFGQAMFCGSCVWFCPNCQCFGPNRKLRNGTFPWWFSYQDSMLCLICYRAAQKNGLPPNCQPRYHIDHRLNNVRIGELLSCVGWRSLWCVNECNRQLLEDKGGNSSYKRKRTARPSYVISSHDPATCNNNNCYTCNNQK